MAPGQGQLDFRSPGGRENLHGGSVKSDEWTCPGGSVRTNRSAIFFGLTVWQGDGQGWNPCSQHWNHGVLTTRPPGNSSGNCSGAKDENLEGLTMSLVNWGGERICESYPSHLGRRQGLCSELPLQNTKGGKVSGCSLFSGSR